MIDNKFKPKKQLMYYYAAISPKNNEVIEPQYVILPGNTEVQTKQQQHRFFAADRYLHVR